MGSGVTFESILGHLEVSLGWGPGSHFWVTSIFFEFSEHADFTIQDFSRGLEFSSGMKPLSENEHFKRARQQGIYRAEVNG